MSVLTVSVSELIKDQFPALQTSIGARIIAEDFHPEAFGDSYVVFQTPYISLRIVRERGQFFAEISALSDPEEWWDLELIEDLIEGRKAPRLIRAISHRDLQSYVSSIMANFNSISALFSPNQLSSTVHSLTMLQSKRASLMFGIPAQP